MDEKINPFDKSFDSESLRLDELRVDAEHMSRSIKNYLGAAIIVSILVVAFSTVSFVSSYSKMIEPSSFRSFSASGEGKIVAVPDVAQFSFSVITEGGKNIGELQQKNTGLMNEAIDFVKSEGVETKDIKTQSYNIEPRYQYYSCPNPPTGGGGPCPPPDIVGYKITQTVSVKIRDFTKIGNVLSGVVEHGANSASSLSFTIDDPTNLQNQARAEAIKKAKEKARAIAEAGGFRLGRLLSIEESGYYPAPYYRAEALSMGVDIVAAPKIEPGSQEVTANVVLKYEIE